MKLSKSALVVLALGGVLVSLQYQSIYQLPEQVSIEEQYIDAAQSLSTTPISAIETSDVRSEYRIETNQDEPRFTEIGNGEVRLNIPSGVSASSQWKTIEQLRSSTKDLDEELRFTIEEQGEEFRIVDISDYRDFLDTLDLDVATQQNILAQLIDSNQAGFTRMLHHAVELQANGYVAWITDPNRDNGYFDFIADSSPASVMGRNLDPDQLQNFYDFEASRLSQSTESPDYIAELVEKLGL